MKRFSKLEIKLLLILIVTMTIATVTFAERRPQNFQKRLAIFKIHSAVGIAGIEPDSYGRLQYRSTR